MMLNSGNLVAISLPEIASWALPEDPLVSRGAIFASLPALQRGSVWKAHQVELLWDSLVRGMPIGAFLLARFDGDRGDRPIGESSRLAHNRGVCLISRFQAQSVGLTSWVVCNL